MTDQQFEIIDINLCNAVKVDAIKRFLTESGLDFDKGINYMAALCDADYNICGCGALDGNIIKCVALSPQLQGQGAAASLITRLITKAFEQGIGDVKVFTKPNYKQLFESLGFTCCGVSKNAVLLESDSASMRDYLEYLSRHKADGVIVMNANPTTLGHLYLIEKAANHCNKLAVIPVYENSKNLFSYTERLHMLRRATAHISNVEVLEGSDYAISPSTFPSYFIKEKSEISRTHAELDLDIFCRKIATSLGATKRFVGTEPTDELTREYNEVMKNELPGRGIEVIEIERKHFSKDAISASKVRQYLDKGDLSSALNLTPSTDAPSLLAYLACRALRMELELSPKPGLVDPYDNGSHNDMDYNLMSRSIKSLRKGFYRIARLSFDKADISGDDLRDAGIETEREMLEATGGINTHRGAIFSMGLTIAAAARILNHHSQTSLQEEIKSLAKSVARNYENNRTSHGSIVRNKYGLPGAMETALGGYHQIFGKWLPYYKENIHDKDVLLKLLLRIISDMPDTNAYYRSGEEAAIIAMHRAEEVLNDFSLESVERLNEEYKSINISHGGAADMLALTIFIASIEESSQ